MAEFLYAKSVIWLFFYIACVKGKNPWKVFLWFVLKLKVIRYDQDRISGKKWTLIWR